VRRLEAQVRAPSLAARTWSLDKLRYSQLSRFKNFANSSLIASASYNSRTVRSPSTDAATSVPTRVPRQRWGIAWLLALGVLVNYFDRVNLSVCKDALQAEFGISVVTFGYLLSAYNWTYCILQMPVGVLLDRLGISRVGRVSIFLWSVATFGTAAATGVNSFFAARFLLGVGEAPSFPANAKAVGYWFPSSERSLATAMFDSAAKFSSAIGVPLLGLVLLHFGWRWSFSATGVISVFYLLLFWWLYRDPSQHESLSAEERDFIVRGGAQPESHVSEGQGAPLAYLLRHRQVYGLCLGFASYNYTFYLLLTWLPSYLSLALHIDLLHSVLYTAVPWVFATICDLAMGGWVVDRLIQNGRDAVRVRQWVLVGGTVLGLGLLGAARAHTPAAALFWISLSIGGLSAAAPVGWSIPSLIAPRNSVGRIGGILNFSNQIAGIAAPILTGYIVAATHSFAGAFLAAAVLQIVSIAAYLVLLGRMEPIPEVAKQ
jgi:MFS transporter, ACS family, D-galactonate transporter